MTDPHKLIAARQFGEIRYAVTSDSSSNLSSVLTKFGLISDATLLVEHERETAFAILVELLWKDMAYEVECMPRELAEAFAHEILSQHSFSESRYFSNGNWAKRESWNPLTESTFDAGLIVTCPEHCYFCIWFQDED